MGRVSIAVGLLLAAGARLRGADATVLTVNRHKVSQEEFRWFMEQERAGVFAHFKTQHQVEDSKEFWSQAIGGTTPRALLQTNAVTRIIREKVEQSLFQELGLLPETSYAAFLAEFQRLTRERDQAARQGRTVYGPVRYLQLQFYEHRKALLRARAIEMLAQKRWTASNDDLRTYYDQHRAQFKTQPTYTLEVVTIQASQSLVAGAGAEAVRAAAAKIQSQLGAGDSLASGLTNRLEREDVTVTGQRFAEINADRLGELFPDDAQSAEVQGLTPGKTLLVEDAVAQVRVVRCVTKTAAAYRPYEAVREQVRAQWLDQLYEQHLVHLARQAQVQINQAAIDKLLP